MFGVISTVVFTISALTPPPLEKDANQLLRGVSAVLKKTEQKKKATMPRQDKSRCRAGDSRCRPSRSAADKRSPAGRGERKSVRRSGGQPARRPSKGVVVKKQGPPPIPSSKASKAAKQRSARNKAASADRAATWGPRDHVPAQTRHVGGFTLPSLNR